MGEETIGSALSARRADLGIDQKQAAALIGMSRTTFSSYERDLQRPSAEVLPALARFLEISLEELLNLYGASAIAAIRPSLEHALRERPDNSSAPIKVESADPAVATVATVPTPVSPSHVEEEEPRSSLTPPPPFRLLPSSDAFAKSSDESTALTRALSSPISTVFASPPSPSPVASASTAPEPPALATQPTAAQEPPPSFSPSPTTVRTTSCISVPGSHPPVELLMKTKKKKKKKGKRST